MKILISLVLASLALSGDSLLAQGDALRGLVDRTQNDLRRAEEFERHKGKEITRYENALKHLSDFDRDFTRGHFEKSRLDNAIDDVKKVVDHNTLDPEARDALRHDLEELRHVRAEHDRL